jgi:hypothetical protein
MNSVRGGGGKGQKKDKKKGNLLGEEKQWKNVDH